MGRNKGYKQDAGRTLFENRWIKVQEIAHDMPDGSVARYTSTFGGSGASVAVMPFRHTEKGRLEFLLRKEITPPWLIHAPLHVTHMLSSLTGMIDGDEEPYEAVIREVHEEAGYVVTRARITPMGWVHVSKTSQNRVHLFAVDVNGLEPEEALGDGTGFEEHAQSLWVRQLTDCVDVTAFALLHKLKMNLAWDRVMVKTDPDNPEVKILPDWMKVD